jgi:hypothetical protein
MGELIAGLELMGFSEGSIDGIFETIEVCGVADVDEDLTFTERTGSPTRFVFVCSLCCKPIGVTHLRSLPRASARHCAKAHDWHRKAAAERGVRWTCISQPKKFCPTTASGSDAQNHNPLCSSPLF